MKKALIVWGGWDGHEPELIAKRFEKTLIENGFSVEVADSLSVYDDKSNLEGVDLLIPICTMIEMTREQSENVSVAVASGMGIAGCHGGMCDSARNNVLWQFITGGNWVSHPGGDGIEYVVNIKNSSSPLTAGINDFTVSSEHYYLHVDPAVEILATTDFPNVKWYHSTNGKFSMPVVWTKKWGHGRVYYNSLGHHDDIFDIPEAMELMKRGMLWAAEGYKIAKDNNLGIEEFESTKGMY